MVKSAVILLNYNTSSDCRKCISYLKKQQNVDIEIVVVDNCSCKSDLSQLRTLCKEELCTLIENKKNQGYNAGNNIGLRYAAHKGYEYALIANPDMEFPNQNYLIELFNTISSDSEVVACGSDIIGLDGKHQNPLKKDDQWWHSYCWILLPFKKKNKSANIHTEDYKQSHNCYKLHGCCFFVNIPFIKSIGFLDEHTFLYCEESILARQVLLKGRKMFYNASVQAIHAHVDSNKGNPILRMKQWKNSRIYFINKYSNYSWLGKHLSILSISFYFLIFSILKKPYRSNKYEKETQRNNNKK